MSEHIEREMHAKKARAHATTTPASRVNPPSLCAPLASHVRATLTNMVA
ncbi:hypothetical protein [Burkholderia diffusa]